MQLEDYTDENGRTYSGVKTTYKNHVTVTENNLLGETDWMYVRKKERDINVPSDVVTNRSAITTEATRLKTAIDSATTEEQVIATFQSASWPEDN
jgi:hypothetical protein